MINNWIKAKKHIKKQRGPQQLQYKRYYHNEDNYWFKEGSQWYKLPDNQHANLVILNIVFLTMFQWVTDLSVIYLH